MAYKRATVNVNAATPSVNPDTIVVNKPNGDNGVIWTIPNTTHRFTDVTFDDHSDNFSNMSIGENDAKQSTLQIDDSIKDAGEIKYNLFYIKKDDPNNVLEIDPKIKNER
jgi:hypothetical protein